MDSENGRTQVGVLHGHPPSLEADTRAIPDYLRIERMPKSRGYLTEYYGVRRMRINLDGKRVGKGNSGCYLKNRAYFTRLGLKKRIVLHELYHHLVENNGHDLSTSIEEKEANSFAKVFLSS